MTETLKLTDRGTLTLSRNMRKKYALQANDLLIVEATDDGILLRPAIAEPIEIYSQERIQEFAEAEENLANYYKKQK